MEAKERDPIRMDRCCHVGLCARRDRPTDLFGDNRMTTKKKAEAVPTVIMDQMEAPHLMEATIRIAASLAMKFGVLNPVPSQGDEIAKAALVGDCGS